MKVFEVDVSTNCYYRFSIQAKDWDEAQDKIDEMRLEDILSQCEEPAEEEFLEAEIIGEL